MFDVVRGTWALFTGILLLMIGNGLQGTLLGVRGGIEGFSTFAMSIVMAGYFAGFLLGSQLVPEMIKRVGHVRVFAALGSFISAGLILYPVLTDPISWTVLRFAIGFCFCGVYIAAESWLNNATSNETRGQALSLYLIVQTGGIVTAQVIFAYGDAGGWFLFILPSVLVSVSFAPILLTISPVPPFEQTKPMTLRKIFEVSPLGCVGMFLLGGMYSALFGMSAVYGADVNLSSSEVALFVGAIFTGGMVLQYPIGWLSDRMDRRQLILWVSVIGAVAALPGMIDLGGFVGLIVVAFAIGGMANPLYALILAYTNDFLEPDDMASASGRLLFINGFGAIFGPLVTGWLMEIFGPPGFFLFLVGLFGTLAVYAAYRMTQRPSPNIEDYSAHTPVAPTSTVVTIEAVAEEWVEQATDQENETEAA